MTITALPTPPSRNDPSNFATRADAFLGALPDFATEANALAAAVNADEIAADASATAAASSASAAASSASSASSSASAASSSASAASASASAAAASYDSFDDRYLGAKSSDPSVDNDGNALLAGALYWNTTVGEMRVYSGTVWVSSYLTTGAQTISGVKTFSSNPVLSGGTADGVLYLNGSKVATSGSALTFDGTTLATTGKFGITGSGSTPTASALQIGTNGVGSRWLYNVPTGGEHNFTENGTVLSWQNISTLGWLIGGSEQMRLTSTGLGIGTSSPQTNLHVSGTTNGWVTIQRGNDAANIAWQSWMNSNGSNQWGLGLLDGSNNLQVFNYATTSSAAVFDTSGNLGLGVTPSAWNSAYKAMDVGNSLSLIGGSSAGDLYYNAYINSSGGFVYRATTTASAYSLAGGQHRWLTAPSGTAGNAITFTQAMTLDASGFLTLSATGPRLVISPATGTNSALIQYNNTGGTAYVGLDNSVGGVSTAYALALYHSGAYPITFSTSGTERARITSGGVFLVNRTTLQTSVTDACKLQVLATLGDWASSFENSSASAPYGINVTYSGASPNGTGNEFLYCVDSTAARVSIRSNGGIANYQANDVNLSDRREKTNFAPAKSYLNTICAIPVQTFNYIDQSEDDPGLTLGVVAQDVQAVAPELVMESNWGTKEDPKMRLSIYQTDLQYALMKCIQEQQALITSLTARVALLEGN